MQNLDINKPTPDKIVAYFDFDGTLTKHDTLFPFVFYVVGIFKFISKLHLVLMVLFLYYMNVFNNEKAKEFFLTIMFKGLSKSYIESKAKLFAVNKLDKGIKSEIYTKLEYHLEHGHKIILVSANLGIYLRYWAQKHKLADCIATEIEFHNGLATGKLATRNCYGKHKIDRIREYIAKNHPNFVYSYGYGNSHGDYALLSYVDEGYWISGTNIVNWNEYRSGRK